MSSRACTQITRLRVSNCILLSCQYIHCKKEGNEGKQLLLQSYLGEDELYSSVCEHTHCSRIPFKITACKALQLQCHHQLGCNLSVALKQPHRSAAYCATVFRKCLLCRYECYGARHVLSAGHSPAARGMYAYRPAACRLASNMSGGKHRFDLVSRVKEGQQPPLLHHLENTLPLLRGGVHPSGVMSTCMQENH